ncbi:MAG: C-5 sterol desaturase [Flavobacteriales bacterium]|nr:sterol desaturase family protein [Bacteroidales bacterium AH-315-I05]PCJ90052.1 MAG: C-5 sterol desaturase [Flavobacteriales bacterium]
MFAAPEEVYNDPTVYAIPLYLAVIGVEIFINIKDKLKVYESKDSLACIAMGLGSLVVGVLMKSMAWLAFMFLYQFRVIELDSSVWWYWVILWFADDFSFYWHHRLSHEVRILWAAHVNHHSSQKLNFSVAVRQSWTELFYKYFFWLWLPLLGFEPIHILFMISINLIYQFFQHTQVCPKLGPIEWFFNTPSHHRVHHASNIIYLDRNHAGTLIIWDRMFGTFQKENESEPCIYGITNNIETFNPLKIATHEFVNLWNDIKRANRFSDKLKYVLCPPGWSHEGDNKSSNHLRQQLKKQQAAA